MANSHGVADMAYELQATTSDLLPACVVSTTPPAPVSGLTLAAFATRAYVRAGQQLTYVDQPAVTVTLVGGDGTYWLAVTDDTFSAFSGWTRRAGSHYMWRLSATRPSDLDNLLTFAQLTVSGGNISAVTTPVGVAPPLARQTADAVAITGGTIGVETLGVGTPAPAPGPTRLAVVGGNIRAESGIAVPASSDTSVQGYHTQLAAGGTRRAFYAEGTAPSRLNGPLGLGVDPSGARALHILYNKTGQDALVIQHGTTDTPGGQSIYFLNVAGTAVGSVATTGTTTTYNTSSDGRLKEAVEALPDALATITRLCPVAFRWKGTGEVGQGFIAQDVQAVVPQAVLGDPNDPTPCMQMDHSKLIPHLVGAVKDLAQQVQALTARLGALEAAG